MNINKDSVTITNRKTLFTPLFFVTCFCFLFILSYRLVLAFFPSTNSGGSENGILYFVQRVINGSVVYTNPSEAVYATAQYTPLYYYFIGTIAKLLSIRANDVLELFIINRVTSLLLDLGLCFIVSRIIKKIFGLGDQIAYTTAIIVFIFLLPLSRIDNLYISLWFTSLYFFLKAMIYPGRNLYLPIAALSGVLSLLSKQSGITILLICGTWLLITKQYKRMVIYYGWAGSLFSLFIISFITDLNNLYKNIILGINNGISLIDYFENFVGFYKADGLLFTIGFILSGIILLKQRAVEYRFFLWVLVTQFVLSNLFALKIGSAIYYVSEWIILIIIIIAVFYEKWKIWFSPIHKNAAMIIAIVVILSKTSGYFPRMYWYCTPSNYQSGKQNFMWEKNVAEYLLTKRQNKKPYVFSDLNCINTYLCNLLPQQYLFPQKDITNTVYDRGVYDFSELGTQLQRQVGYFVCNRPVDNFKIFDVAFTGLKKDTSIGIYFIYSINP